MHVYAAFFGVIWLNGFFFYKTERFVTYINNWKKNIFLMKKSFIRERSVLWYQFNYTKDNEYIYYTI